MLLPKNPRFSIKWPVSTLQTSKKKISFIIIDLKRPKLQEEEGVRLVIRRSNFVISKTKSKRKLLYLKK